MFLVIIIAAGGLVDHAKEVGVVNVEFVVNAEGTPPILERHEHFIIRYGPIQAHKLGLPNHLQLDDLPLLVVVRYLDVHWHVLCLTQKKIDKKDDTGNLQHWYVLRLMRVLTEYFALRLYLFRITRKLSSVIGRES